MISFSNQSFNTFLFLPKIDPFIIFTFFSPNSGLELPLPKGSNLSNPLTKS